MAWSVLSALLFVVGVTLHAPAMWLGFLLALPLMITATGLGWRAALPLMPIGLGLAGMRLMHGMATLELIGLGVLMILGAAAGNNLFGLWHATARAARANEQRARLLSEAALSMASASDTAALFAAMPRLLGEVVDFDHAEVFTHDGDGFRSSASHHSGPPRDLRLPLTSIVGRSWRTGQVQYVADADAEPDYVADAAVAATLTELAVPLLVDGHVQAVLNVEHANVDAFNEADRRILVAFARIAQEVLARLLALSELERQGAEQALVARLTNRLLLVEGTREAAAVTLAEVIPGMDLEIGVVTVVRRGRMHSLAVHGPLSTDLRRMLTEGLRLNPGPSMEAWASRRPLLMRDASTDPTSGDVAKALGARALAVVPVTDAAGEVQALLAVADRRRPRDWSARDRRVLDIMATSLGVVLERATLDRQLAALLNGVRGLARAEEPSDLYHRAADAAVRVIPGAEAASILVRGPTGFEYQAAVGFDLEALRHMGPFSDTEALTWYRNGSEGYRHGVPRIARGSDVYDLHTGWNSGRSPDVMAPARGADIVANICVPISDGGEVIAILNADSFADPQAFGSAAMRLAEAFAQQVAAVVRQAETLEVLQRSAVTDPLTGLGNRAGFHRQLDLELARARRHGHGIGILLLDLDVFKQINDRYGHQAGDDALVQVARALSAAARGSDSVFRWGGDEFVLLLPEATRANSDELAARFGDAVASVVVDDIRLGASIGSACYPDDGEDPDTLVRRADDGMYRTKARRQRAAADPAESEG